MNNKAGNLCQGNGWNRIHSVQVEWLYNFHLYSIPQQKHWRGAAARVTLAFCHDGDAGDTAVCLLLRSCYRLHCTSSW